MKEELKKFIINDNISIMDALCKIDENKKGFLIVVDVDNTVLGTLTDGDIRRAFIAGSHIDDVVKEIYCKSYTSLSVQEDFAQAIDVFKNCSIKFLPILDKDKKLVNVITKNQLHALLLQDIHGGFDYDFLKLDEAVVDHEIFQRPWGFYKTTVLNEFYQSKVITVYPKAQLSLQSHGHREEHWIVVHGFGQVQIGDSIIEVTCGSSLFIPKGCKHRITNVDNKESLIITEVQIGDYLGEDDIIRYEDIYGRV